MNEADLAHFSDKLRETLEDLSRQNDLGSEGQKTVMLDQQSVGRLSRMDALQGQAMAQATAQRRELQIRKIHAALERIAEGEFGYCFDCGDLIARPRLDLDPTATLCISCARR